MQDGCKVYMDSLHGIEWIMFHGHLDYSQKPPLGGRFDTKKSRDHGTQVLTTVDLFYLIMWEDPRE